MSAKPKYVSEVSGSTTHITIRSSRTRFGIVTFAALLASWSYGAALLLRAITSPLTSDTLYLKRGIIITWAVVAIPTLYELLWLLVGAEQINLASDSITLRNTVFGIGWPKKFPGAGITQMRTDPEGVAKVWLSPEGGFEGTPSRGMIAFNYRHKRIGFGFSLDLADAVELVAEIRGRYPQYK